MNAVKKHAQHPTADEIYQELKQDNPKLSLATVYRNLNQFADAGELGRFNMEGEPVHFDTFTEEHSHAICEECGQIIDIHNESLNQKISACVNAVEELADFQIKRTDLKFIGRCVSCAANQAVSK